MARASVAVRPQAVRREGLAAQIARFEFEHVDISGAGTIRDVDVLRRNVEHPQDPERGTSERSCTDRETRLLRHARAFGGPVARHVHVDARQAAAALGFNDDVEGAARRPAACA